MKKTTLTLLITAVLLFAAGCRGELPLNTINTDHDLTGTDIGVIENSLSAVFTSGFETVKTYASPETLLFDLKNNVIDCAVMEKNVAKSAMKQVRGLKSATELITAELCFAVAKENPDLRADINAALNKLRDNGVIKSMTDGYFGGKAFKYESPESLDRSKGTLTVAVDGTLWPYAYDDGAGSITGLDIDLARAVCDSLGVDLEVTVVDRADLLKTVQIGKADFALGCIYENEEDAALVDFSDSYIESTQLIIVRR
jgi:polar amino acid transport system substrate-binding protein